MNIFWFRRDLRLTDNVGLKAAIASDQNVQPIFIFDTNILDELEKDDARVTFIYNTLKQINAELNKVNSSILILHGKPEEIWQKLIEQHDINTVFTNRDYEPYALKRDRAIKSMLDKANIEIRGFKDQVIFEPKEVLKADGKPYTVYTPFKNKWLSQFKTATHTKVNKYELKNLVNSNYEFPSIESIGFKKSTIKVKPFDLSVTENYHEKRDFPAADATSNLGPHLRFGTVSVRQIINQLDLSIEGDHTFLTELIWREFFMQILFHFPDVVDHNFRKKYDGVKWLNDQKEFDKWCKGETGYPMVDAGMRQLNQTGYIHNRVRMVVAGFLCKHLLIDWKWGEAYFASKLLDYDLASNNGNWQWAAGTGCDAAPYFRIFNPIEQLKKFDKSHAYISKWVPELNTTDYPDPMVEHKFARERALETYKAGLN
ncbi:MAG: cryptochrome/photolyase family protein [Putridiphycobacter sp.]